LKIIIGEQIISLCIEIDYIERLEMDKAVGLVLEASRPVGLCTEVSVQRFLV
jgi:hypothetical protein